MTPILAHAFGASSLVAALAAPAPPNVKTDSKTRSKSPEPAAGAAGPTAPAEPARECARSSQQALTPLA